MLSLRDPRARSYLLALIVVLLPIFSHAQSPRIQWFTNVSGTLFSLDLETNIHVNAHGPIVKLNADGIVLSSNTICPLYARAQKSFGGFVFAGTFTPPYDFGGMTLTNGRVFLVRYDEDGTLFRAQSFGPDTVDSITVTDMKIEPFGVAWVGYWYCLGTNCSKAVASGDYFGTSYQINDLGGGTYQSSSHSVRLARARENNVLALGFDGAPGSNWSITFSQVRGLNQQTIYSTTSQPIAGNQAYRAARPVLNAVGHWYLVEGTNLVKRDSQRQILWSTNLGNSISWTICEDQSRGVYVADSSGFLRRFDVAGNEVWSVSAGSPIDEMLTDFQGTFFFSTIAGTVGRLFPDPPTFSLTTAVVGPGSVSLNPPGGIYQTGTVVTVTATPVAGNGFDKWTGDASGTQNPLSLSMTQNRTVTANFISWPILRANRQGFTPQGFNFTLLGETGMTYQVQSSSNLDQWINLEIVTNTTGQTTVTDPSGTNAAQKFYKGLPWP